MGEFINFEWKTPRRRRPLEDNTSLRAAHSKQRVVLHMAFKLYNEKMVVGSLLIVINQECSAHRQWVHGATLLTQYISDG